MGALRLLLLAILGFTIFYAVNTASSDAPEDEAKRFLATLARGDTDRAVLQFGDNTCQCQPRGGYVAFLKYESGEPENLAFLLNQETKIEDLTVKQVPTKVKFEGGNMPWEVPESCEVEMNLVLPRKELMFLPLDMAYGYDMKRSGFNAFVADPEDDAAKGYLPLRTRPTLAADFIPPPPAPGKAVFTSDIFKDLLEPDKTRYLRPANPGRIIEPDGEKTAAESQADAFPRLISTRLRLLVVRRSRYKPWQVKKGIMLNPVLLRKDGNISEVFKRQD